jgi:disulfide bond formation protein DsbB
MAGAWLQRYFEGFGLPRRLLLLTWLVVTGASIGTLVLSEVMGLVPCELCWYQRGLLYPQILIVGAAVLSQAVWIAVLSVLFSLAGLGVASYHSWLQLQPNPGDTCTVTNPCSAVTLEVAGLSIPNLSLVTFAVVFGLVVAAIAVNYEVFETG